MGKACNWVQASFPSLEKGALSLYGPSLGQGGKRRKDEVRWTEQTLNTWKPVKPLTALAYPLVFWVNSQSRWGLLVGAGVVVLLEEGD